MTGQEATAIDIRKEADDLASWPTHDRLRALKRILPRAHVEDILARAGQDRSPRSRLPGWFMVRSVIALGLVCRDCYRQVFRWLQPFRPGVIPPRSTFCEARHRLGLAPLRLLARDVVHLLGRPETPGAFYRGMRLMALDGFTVDLPDIPKDDHAFGRPGGRRAPGAFPQARILALCEAGSHVLRRWRIEPYHTGEVTMAHRLLSYLRRDMLLLWDRNSLSRRALTEVRRTKAHLLARIKSNWTFEPIRTLPDGSYLAKFYASAKDRAAGRDGTLVRIIAYTFEDPNRPGSGEVHRLLTALLDPELDPAEVLIVLYHERWEQELAIDELKTHQRERPALRSQTPRGVIQELYGLLLGHYVVRVLMQETANRQRIDPQRLSFTAALKILRCRLPESPRSRGGRCRWYEALLSEIGEEVLPERRNRINPRVIKRKMSNWSKKRPEHRHYPQPTKEFDEAIVMLR